MMQAILDGPVHAARLKQVLGVGCRGTDQVLRLRTDLASDLACALNAHQALKLGPAMQFAEIVRRSHCAAVAGFKTTMSFIQRLEDRWIHVHPIMGFADSHIVFNGLSQAGLIVLGDQQIVAAALGDLLGDAHLSADGVYAPSSDRTGSRASMAVISFDFSSQRCCASTSPLRL